MKKDYELEKKNKEIEPKENRKKFDIKALMNMDLRTLKFKLLTKFKNINKLSTPEKKRKVVAFDMGSSMIKIVEGIYYKKDLIIDKYVIVPTPKGAIIDGEIKKEEELKNKLSQVLKENGIKAKYAICTTNSSLIINREIIIPKVEEDEMETVIRYEIQQYLPINLDDYILQGIVLSEKEVDETKKLDVRVIAYPERIARSYYNFLFKLELKPYALDVNYNAVNKFVNLIGINNEFEHNSNDAVALIDLGASSIDVNIYKNGKLDFTRIIKDCGNEIDEMLMGRGDLKVGEMEDFKKGNINLYDEVDTVNILARNVIDEWVDKIEKIIQFYKNRNIDNELNNIMIFGGSSKINGMEEYMTKKIGIRTRIKGIPKIAFKSNDDGKPIDDFINVIGSLIRNE